MAKYELLYIIPGKYTEEELPPIVNGVKEAFSKNQAVIVKEDDLGKKKLAYSIGDNHYGYYQLVVFTAEGEALAKIDEALRMMPEILRHQIVIYLDPAKTTGKAPRIKPAEERSASAYSPAEEKTIVQSIKEKKETQEQTEAAKKKEEAKPKIDLDKLDEKLDELLKDDLNI